MLVNFYLVTRKHTQKQTNICKCIVHYILLRPSLFIFSSILDICFLSISFDLFELPLLGADVLTEDMLAFPMISHMFGWLL